MAAKNSQDGISLIQTAEGALNETHDILQRMRELATQAANDTNTDSDRGEIQKEVNQLTSEINRIGNTTEFNTKSLLNGDVAITGDGKKINTSASSAPVYGTGMANVEVTNNSSLSTGNYKVDVTSVTTNTVGTGQSGNLGSGAAANITGNDVQLSEGSYRVNITKEVAKTLTASPTGDTGVLNSAGGNQAISIQSSSNLANTGHAITIEKSAEKSNTNINDAGISAVNAADANAGTYVVDTKVVLDESKLTGASAAGEIMNSTDGAISNFKIAGDSNLKASEDYTISIQQNNAVDRDTDGNVKLTFVLKKGAAAQETVEATFSATSGAKTIQLGDISFDVDSAKVWASDTASTGTTSSTFHNNTITLGSDSIKNEVTVTKDGDTANAVTKSYTQTAPTAEQTFDFGSGNEFKFKVDNSAFVGGKSLTSIVTTADKYVVKLDGDNASAKTFTAGDLALNSKMTDIALGSDGSGLFVDLSGDELAKMTVGTKTINFNTDTKNTYTAQLQNADGSALAGGAGGKFTLDENAGATSISLGKGVTFDYTGNGLSPEGSQYFSVKGGVETFTMTLTNTDTSKVEDTQSFTNKDGKVTFGSTGVSMDTTDALVSGQNTTFKVESDMKDQSVQLQIGANMGQSFSVDITDMRAKALGISGGSSSDSIKDSKGNTIDNASFTQNESATNGTNSTADEFALDLSSSDKATAAIKVIDGAIEKVSAERSKLGAFQNRLEHTINNLGTSSENLTAAESRIRDVDMAKEMMNQTKNSILSQAAQAMLAQANQQPQGVLQLLR